MNDPFKSSKRQWKRYDPEPEPKEPLSDLAVALWCVVLMLAVVNAANLLSRLTPQDDVTPVPAHTTTVGVRR